jgi:hypothetical protein
VKAQRGEYALFCNIDFTLSCRLRCSVGSNRSGPGKQIRMESNPMLWAQCQTEAENLHWGWGSISNRDLLSLRQARRAEIASRLERHQITLEQANVEMSIMQSQTSETSKRQANPQGGAPAGSDSR